MSRHETPLKATLTSDFHTMRLVRAHGEKRVAWIMIMTRGAPGCHITATTHQTRTLTPSNTY